MYTYYIVKAGEKAPEERINLAIESFGYKNQNVVCIASYGYTSEIQTEAVLRRVLKDGTSILDELAKKYIEQKEKQEEEQSVS